MNAKREVYNGEVEIMEWNEKLQKIIDYIEDYLQRKEEEIDREEIARIAGCPYPFFQKLFAYMTGISFADYIRYRKLTLAGYDLKSSGVKVIEVSYKYGYDSPTSFTKAFQQFHGVTPTQARDKDTELRVYPKMQTEGSAACSWRLQKKEAVRLVGKETVISEEMEERARQVTGFWNTCQADGTFSALIAMDEAEVPGLMGMFGNSSERKDQMTYSIMVVTSKEAPSGFAEYQMPEAVWAVFDCIGPVPGAVQAGWKYLNEEWIVQYPFRHAKLPEIEWYASGNAFGDEYLSQIWIPINEN